MDDLLVANQFVYELDEILSQWSPDLNLKTNRRGLGQALR